MGECEVKVTGLARILLVFGLLVLGVALMVLWRDDRTVSPEQPSISIQDPRVGRTTLSHGGPGVGSPSDMRERPPRPDQNVPLDQASDATKR